MPSYRRAHVPGGTFFFTVVTHRRRRLFRVEANRALLGKVVRECQRDWPSEMHAIVLLPDHLHALWTLPTGDDDDSGRWSVIEKDFTARFLANGGRDAKVSAGKRRERRRGIWQRRFTPLGFLSDGLATCRSGWGMSALKVILPESRRTASMPREVYSRLSEA